MILYDKFYFLCIVKKKKKKVFDEKFGTLGENDVIEKLLMLSYFFLHPRVHFKEKV